jgi:hypothetical protein
MALPGLGFRVWSLHTSGDVGNGLAGLSDCKRLQSLQSKQTGKLVFHISGQRDDEFEIILRSVYFQDRRSVLKLSCALHTFNTEEIILLM